MNPTKPIPSAELYQYGIGRVWRLNVLIDNIVFKIYISSDLYPWNNKMYRFPFDPSNIILGRSNSQRGDHSPIHISSTFETFTKYLYWKYLISQFIDFMSLLIRFFGTGTQIYELPLISNTPGSFENSLLLKRCAKLIFGKNGHQIASQWA